MRVRLGRLPGLLVAFAIVLQWVFPVSAAAPGALPSPTTLLLPQWFTGRGPGAGQAAESSLALLPAWYGGGERVPEPRYTTLSITASARPNPVDQGRLLTYVIAVGNETAAMAEQVVVTGTTPEGTVFESARVVDDGGASWFLGGLSPGQNGSFVWFTTDRVGLGEGLPGRATATLELVVRVVGPFPDPGRVHSREIYADAANAARVQAPDVTTTVRVRPGEPEPLAVPPTVWQEVGARLTAGPTTLTVTKSAAPDPVDQGDLLTYVITVTNQTAEPAQQVVVTDTTPAGTVFHSASVLSGGGATWFWGGLSAGDSGDFIWFTSDRLGLGGGLPGNSTARLQFVVRVVGPFIDQSTIENGEFYADASNASIVQGATVTTTVNAPAFTLGKIASSDPITAGERLIYTITLTNTGHLATSLPYTIVETLPAHTVLADSSPPALVAGDTLTWTLTSPLGIGQAISVTCDVTVTAPLTTGLLLVNTDYWAFSEEVTPAAEGPPLTTTVASWPTLLISKVAQPALVQAGDLVTYTLAVTNAATAIAPAMGTFVTDTLPSTVAFHSCEPSCSAVGGGHTVTWTVGVLQPGESRTFTLTGRVYSPLDDGTLLTNRAAISANNALAASETFVVSEVDSAPLLSVGKTVTPFAVVAGSVVTYTITVTNTGNATAGSATITDTLPGPFTFGGMVQGDAPVVAGNVLTWTNQVITGTIWPAGWLVPPGPLTLVFTATAGGVNGVTYYNAVTVTQGPVSATTGPTAPVIVDTPDLRLSKTDAPDPVAPGQPLVYTLVYSNASPVAASGVVITDTLPDFIVGGYSSAPYVGTIAAGQTITWNVGLLPGNSGDQTISLVVTPTLPLTNGLVLTNVAGIACDEGILATTGPVTTEIQSSPDMVLVKAALPLLLLPDELVTYTLVFSNAGSATAAAVITDALPISLTDIVSSTTPNVTFAGSSPPVYTWTVAALAPGVQGMITITGRVMTTTAWGQSTLITNTAGITATGDLVPGNNFASVPVTVVPGPVDAITLTADPTALTVDCASVITAEVRDAWGNAVSDGTVVTFTTSTGTSAASPSTAVTTLGEATTSLTSTLPGTVVVTATAANGVTGTTSVDFAAGVPYAFQFGPIADPQTAGVPFGVVITATDQYGNLAVGFVGTATLSDDTGTLSPTVTYPASGGVLTQTVTITGAMIGDQITASAQVTPDCGASFTAVGVSAPFTVVHALPAELALAPPNHSVVAGNTLPYAATATDGYGNAWTATSEVTFTTSGGNSFLGLPPGNNVFSATTTGVDFPVTGTIAGSGGPVVATTGVTVTHGSAVSLSISPRDVITSAGQLVTYTAVATDVFGNGWDATGEVSWAAGGGNTFSVNVLSATVAGTWPVTGTLGGVSDSTQITITSGAVAALLMGPVSDPQTAGVGFGLVVTATDAFGNVSTTFGGTLNLVDTTGTLLPATWSTWTGGVANPVVAVSQATTSDRITASLAATPTILVVSNPFAVVANVPNTVAYTTPASLRVCETAPVTATVTDQFGNLVADGTVVTLTTSIGLYFVESGTSSYYPTTTDGVATATIAAGTTAGLATTQASAGAASSPIRSINVVTPGLPSSASLGAAPAAVQVGGNTGTLTATVLDCAGNAVADGTLVDFTIVPPLATIAPDPSATTGGVATATFTSGVTAGVAVVTATADGAVATTTLTFLPGDAYTVTLSAVPATLVANGSDTAALVVTVTDQYGNAVADGTAVNLSQSPTLGTIVPGSPTTTDGVAQATFTAGTDDGSTTVTAQVGGRSDSVVITLLPVGVRYVYLPLTMRESRGINLVVESIVVDPPSPTPGQPVMVYVTVRNTGFTAIESSFWVDLYLDPGSTPAPGVRWDQICAEGVAWLVPGLGGGEAVTLRSDRGSPAYTYWTGAFSATPDPHRLYAVADVWPGPPGAILEDRENDNVRGPVMVPMGP